MSLENIPNIQCQVINLSCQYAIFVVNKTNFCIKRLSNHEYINLKYVKKKPSKMIKSQAINVSLFSSFNH